MKRNSKHFIVVFFCCTVLTSILSAKIQAQNVYDIRINEVLVINDSNYVDDFGHRGSWFELFNSAYNYVNVGGMYISNDPKNPKMYYIPKNDPITLIPPRGFLVFWADGKTTYGTLHLNFTLSDCEFLGIFDSGGNLIDKLEFKRSDQKPDISFGRVTDGEEKWEFKKKCTPNATNTTEVKVSTSEEFGKMDPIGIGMAIIAMSVVFGALAIIYIMFKMIGKFFSKDKKIHNSPVSTKTENHDIKASDISGEENAAIALALNLYFTELHDEESTRLTISRISRNYSPWSSKIYGIRKPLR